MCAYAQRRRWLAQLSGCETDMSLMSMHMRAHTTGIHRCTCITCTQNGVNTLKRRLDMCVTRTQTEVVGLTSAVAAQSGAEIDTKMITRLARCSGALIKYAHTIPHHQHDYES